MSSWLSAIERSLDSPTTLVDVFFRDDDGGWDDRRLLNILAIFRRHVVPIDIAVIPTAASGKTIDAIARTNGDGTAQVRVHQHGFSHVNHESAGRKSEYGDSRSLSEATEEIEFGQALLSQQFGVVVDRIFTPPWNRCSHDLAKLLPGLGFNALSRDGTAKPFRIAGLAEIPVQIDWVKRRGEKRIDFTSLGDWIGDSICTQRTLGIMLHHAVMDSKDLEELSEMLKLFKASDNVRCIPMNEMAWSDSQ